MTWNWQSYNIPEHCNGYILSGFIFQSSDCGRSAFVFGQILIAMCLWDVILFWAAKQKLQVSEKSVHRKTFGPVKDGQFNFKNEILEAASNCLCI
jgi:hypothetical protein